MLKGSKKGEKNMKIINLWKQFSLPQRNTENG